MKVVLFALVALGLFASTASAQYIVIRTGKNADELFATPLMDGKLTIGLPSGEKISIPIEFIDTGLSREVSRSTPSARPNPPSGSSTPVTAPSAMAIITTHCKQEWPTNFRMQAYCIRTQQEALHQLMALERQ